MDELTRLAFDARAGDEGALAALVRRTQADVWRLCAHLVDAGAADDLTQETFERAFGALPRYEGRAPVRTWLLAIARRTCMDELRRRTRRRNLVARVTAQRPREAGPDHAGSVALDELLATLDDDRRQAFVLTQVLGLPYAEAADVCGCPVGTIRSRVARAREQLAASLEAPATDEGTCGDEPGTSGDEPGTAGDHAGTSGDDPGSVGTSGRASSGGRGAAAPFGGGSHTGGPHEGGSHRGEPHGEHPGHAAGASGVG